MKLQLYLIAACLLMSSGLVQAQRYDTSGMAKEQRRTEGNRANESRNAEENQTQGTPNDRGMVVVDKDDLPESLRETLQDEKYAGWENGTIYQNTETGEYLIAPRAYRFDSKGREIRVRNAPAYPESREDASWSESKRSGYRTDEPQPPQDDREHVQSDQTTGDQSERSRPESPAQQHEQRGHYEGSDRTNQSGQSEGKAYRNDSEPSAQPSSREPNHTQYTREDLTEIQAEQIPSALRRALEDDQYRG